MLVLIVVIRTDYTIDHRSSVEYIFYIRIFIFYKNNIYVEKYFKYKLFQSFRIIEKWDLIIISFFKK